MMILNNLTTVVDFREGEVSTILDNVDQVTVSVIEQDKDEPAAEFWRTITIVADGQRLTLNLKAHDYDGIRIFEEWENRLQK